MALPVAVAPAPSSSSNSRLRRKKAYPLLDLHQRVKTPMNSIPNPPPPNPRLFADCQHVTQSAKVYYFFQKLFFYFF
jgi:hypothetical protein